MRGGGSGAQSGSAGGCESEWGGYGEAGGLVTNHRVRSNFLRKMSNLLRRLLRGDFSRINQGVYVIPHWFVPPGSTLSQKRVLFALQGDFLLHQTFLFTLVGVLVNKIV